MRIRTRLLIAAGVSLSAILTATVLGTRALAQASPPGNPRAEATARIVTSAQALLATLDEAGRQRALFPFDSPQKGHWSNLPTGIFQRAGLRMGDLSAPQHAAAMSLLAAALSPAGYRKVTEIVHGDEILREGNASRGPGPGSVRFGEAEYYLAFVGTPSTSTPWTLQFGGHHLAINLTFGGARATLAPSHTGAQPASYTIEGRTVRPLGQEQDRAFALVNALDATQRSQAILAYRVADLVLGPGQDGRTIQPEGLRATSMTGTQQTMLLDLVREWVGMMSDAFAAPRMDEIRAHLAETYFAWSGPTIEGSLAYFRVQGPTLVIEYAPQRSLDHIHTIYRDPTNDYGAQYTRK